MESYNDLIEWTKKMNYQGELPPETDRVIFNAATSIIWHHLAKRIIPKQEVDHIKKNVIISQLKAKEKPQIVDEFKMCYVKEIELWERKEHLQTKIVKLQDKIKESENYSDSVSKKICLLERSIEQIKQEIKENSLKGFMYEQKCAALEESIEKYADTILTIKRLTPIEDDYSKNTNILNDLKKCAKKLEPLKDVKNVQIIETTALSNTWQNMRNLNVTSLMNFNSTTLHNSKISWKNRLMNQTKRSIDDSLGIIGDDVIQSTNLEFVEGKEVKEIVADLIGKYNRASIWNTIQDLENEFRIDLENFVSRNNENCISTSDKCNEEHLIKLYSIHIENQLLALKYNNLVQIKEQEIDDLENMIISNLIHKNWPAAKIKEFKLLISLEKEQAIYNEGLHCFNSSLVELNSNVKFDEYDATLKELQNLKEPLNLLVKTLQEKLNVLNYLQLNMNCTRKDTHILVHNLYKFIEDLSWIFPLSDPVISNEIKIFKKINLHNQKKFFYSSKNEFIRDSGVEISPFNLDSNIINKLSTLNCMSFTMPEYFIINLIRSKEKFDNLNELEELPSIFKPFKYAAKDKKQHLTRFNNFYDQLQRICNTNFNRALISKMNEKLEIWLNEPFKDYISSERLHNDKDYKYYENEFNFYFKQL